jgi:hypothetical protein
MRESALTSAQLAHHTQAKACSKLLRTGYEKGRWNHPLDGSGPHLPRNPVLGKSASS